MSAPPNVAQFPVYNRPAEDYDFADKCNGKHEPLTTFFPRGGHETQQRAKQLCRACPVRQQCLDYALKHDEWHGIWGGFNGPERRVIRRQQRALERREAGW